MIPPVLEVRGVERSFDDHTGPRRVIAGVDLTVGAGEIVALVGPPGSGKTTLLSIVTGFEQPDAGTVRVAGAQWTALARAAVVRPRLLVADEPVSHQNHARAQDVMAVVVDLAAAGSACLLATHDEVAVSAAHPVVELRDGAVHGELRPR